jgi:putative hydrolase of the HAD superfamily
MGFMISRFPRSWVMTYEQLCANSRLPTNAKVRQQVHNTAAYFKYGPFKAFVGIKTALRRLRRNKHRLHLITAGEVILQRRKIEQAGLVKYFDDGNFTVCPMHKKDDMQRLAEEFDGPVMMVGDSKRNDIRPAKELGLTTVWIPSETKHDSDGEVEPDHEISSFTLLPERLPKIKPK